ncbi:MAG: hypothetical protein CMF70_06735 [Magnetovibrio sp.]|nr:hypothetical protein [Magnetovibrio sp.]
MVYEVDYRGNATERSLSLTTMETAASDDHVVEVDPFALPEHALVRDWGFDADQENVAMRSLYSRAYVDDDTGKTHLMTTADPMHYRHDDGTWKDIDVNVVATDDGWAVTESSTPVAFARDVHQGVAMTLPDQERRTVTVGINPAVVVLDDRGMPMAMDHDQRHYDAATPSVGGNAVRYYLRDGFELDYAVRDGVLKQALVVRAQPTKDDLEGATWFGLTEHVVLPDGFALYADGNKVVPGAAATTTQEALSIRDERGEEVAAFPPPVVEQAPTPPTWPGEPVLSQEPYTATYFVRYDAEGGLVVATVVETAWVLDPARVFPLKLDPSVTTSTSNHGYCRPTSKYCGKQSSASAYTMWRMSEKYTSLRYIPFIVFDLPRIQSDATILQITLSANIRIGFYGGNILAYPKVDLVMMQDCGTGSIELGATVSCTDDLVDPYFSGSYSHTCGGDSYKCARATYGSNAVASSTTADGIVYNNAYDPSGAFVSGHVCNSAQTCASSVGASVSTAYHSGGNVGAGFHIDGTKSGDYPGVGARLPKGSYYVSPTIEVVFIVPDTAPPKMISVAYANKVSYVEGTRTMFAKFSDQTGVDTSAGNAPTLQYTINEVSQIDVEGTVVGTCTTHIDRQECRVKATTVAIHAGDTVKYWWRVRDTVANEGTTAETTFSVRDVADVPADAVYTRILTEGVNSDILDMLDPIYGLWRGDQGGFHDQRHYDRQLTFWEATNGGDTEYLHEWDTSRCGRGYYACFDHRFSWTDRRSEWQIMWDNNPHGADLRISGVSMARQMLLLVDNGGFLEIDETHGPNMNLLFWYDADKDTWSVVGIGDENTGISDKMHIETKAPIVKKEMGISVHLIAVDAQMDDATFGNIELEQTGTTYQTTKANWMCVGSHGWTYFFRSTSTRPSCNGNGDGVSLPNNSLQEWSGFVLGMKKNQHSASYYETSYVTYHIKPVYDSFPPQLRNQNAGMDTHATTTTIVYDIEEVGDPRIGLDPLFLDNYRQPTLHYTITDADGIVGTKQSVKLLTPIGVDREDCLFRTCSWTYKLQDVARGSTVSYYATAQDANGNVGKSNTTTFQMGVMPKKVFVVEWRDIGEDVEFSCTFQAWFYDTTNEIEFRYNDKCVDKYNFAIKGYQDDTETKGATMRGTTNFRFATKGDAHGWEPFQHGDLRWADMPTLAAFEARTGYMQGGLVDLDMYNAYWMDALNLRNLYREQYRLVHRGITPPVAFHTINVKCASNVKWYRWKELCNMNIDMPDDFAFEYFGTMYNGSLPDSRVHISRFGNMYFRGDGVQELEKSIDLDWTSEKISLPTFGRTQVSYDVDKEKVRQTDLRGNIAPHWHRYVSLYCRVDTYRDQDCSINYAVLDYECLVKGFEVCDAVPTFIAVYQQVHQQNNCTGHNDCIFDMTYCDIQTGTCVTCEDGVQNAGETGVDCGGSHCSPCLYGQPCAQNSDCAGGGFCDVLGPELRADVRNPELYDVSAHIFAGGDLRVYEAQGWVNSKWTADLSGGGVLSSGSLFTCRSCTDNIRNGYETDVDCGGPDCPPCQLNKMCVIHGDCVDWCAEDTCMLTRTKCSDGIHNSAETDIDCGGGTCEGCDEEGKCLLDRDCKGDHTWCHVYNATTDLVVVPDGVRQGTCTSNVQHCNNCPVGWLKTAADPCRLPLSTCEMCPAGKFGVRNRPNECFTCLNNLLYGKLYSAPGAESCTHAADAVPPGSGVNHTTRAILPCAIGSYKNWTGVDECAACPVGFHSYDPGATACEPCRRGSFCPGDGTATPCIAGTYTNDTGAGTACTLCPAGFYSYWSRQKQHIACETCRAGHYCPGTGSYGVCSYGRYATSTGQASADAACTRCPAGFHSYTVAATTCEPCRAGHYCTGGGWYNSCPFGTYGNITGATTSNEACESCPIDKPVTVGRGNTDVAACHVDVQCCTRTDYYSYNLGLYGTDAQRTLGVCAVDRCDNRVDACCWGGNHCWYKIWMSDEGSYFVVVDTMGYGGCGPGQYEIERNIQRRETDIHVFTDFSECSDCPMGFYKYSAPGQCSRATECTACPDGWSSPAGASTCTLDTACPVGHVCKDKRMWSCDRAFQEIDTDVVDMDALEITWSQNDAITEEQQLQARTDAEAVLDALRMDEDIPSHSMASSGIDGQSTAAGACVERSGDCAATDGDDTTVHQGATGCGPGQYQVGARRSCTASGAAQCSACQVCLGGTLTAWHGAEDECTEEGLETKCPLCSYDYVARHCRRNATTGEMADDPVGSECNECMRLLAEEGKTCDESDTCECAAIPFVSGGPECDSFDSFGSYNKAWCYTVPGACDDGVQSTYLDDYEWSYAACNRTAASVGG